MSKMHKVLTAIFLVIGMAYFLAGPVNHIWPEDEGLHEKAVNPTLETKSAVREDQTITFSEDESSREVYDMHYDWPVWRYDTALTGRSTLKGDLTNAPVVSWRYSLRGMRGLLAIRAGQPGQHMAAQCSQPLGQDYLARWGSKWGMNPFVYKLRSGKTLELSEAAERRVGRIHPDLPEPQEVIFTGKQAETRGRLYAWDTPDGARREVWSSSGGNAAWERWNICFGDIDGDGTEEIIVAGHGGVMVYDPRSGKLKCECKYGHRSRGFIGVADIDNDGADEFLDIGLFQIAIEVCDYKHGTDQEGELSVLWGDKIELDIRAHSRMINTPFDALCDIDGDGRYEVVYNMYNDHGDDQWHLVIRDALTGDVKWDIPRVFLNDSVNLDGDGARELVGIHTEGRFCQGFSHAFIAHLKPGGLEPLWTHEAARWPARPVLRMPPDRSTFRSAGGPIHVCQGDFLGDGCQGLIFSTQPGGTGTPEIFSVVKCGSNGEYHAVWWVEAPAAASTQVQAIADIDGDGADEVLIEWRSNGLNGATAKGSGARVDIVSWQPLTPRPGQPIAADMHGQGKLTVLATSAVDEVVAIAPPSSRQDKPRELWRRPGRGHDQINCLSAADLTGDGKYEVAVVSQAPSGKARVTAVDGNGETVWHVDYDDIHGQRYIFRMGGLTHVWIAHLTDPERCDVYVSVLRSIMHSDVVYALRGTDGQLLWKQSMAGNTGYGGSGMAFADTNGDGLDEIFCSYPDCYWTADGRTGEVTLFTNPGKVFPNWAAYAIPIVADFNGDGKPEVFHPSQYVWGLLTLDGKKIWNLPGEDVPRVGVLPGLGDVDGDGKMEIGAPFSDGFRCYDAGTGELKWKLKVPSGPYAGVISADIDGDDRDEFLFAAGSRLVAVKAAGTSGKILWQVELPGRLGEPIFADVNNDGQGEILLVCRDGMLYCLDQGSMITAISSSAALAGGETLSERLGYSPDDKLLIIHADDVGMSHSVNRATIRAFEAGMVTCGSIMVPCPWFSEIAAYCREHPEADLGLHLTLTSEWKYYRWGPAASKDKLPSLLDEEGFLWRTAQQVREHAKPEEVEIELRAQIERALEFGVRPTHLDTHMGTVFVSPQFFEIYCRLGKEYNIPPMLIKLTPEVRERIEERGFELPEDVFEMLQKSGYPFLDRIVTDGGSGQTFEEKKASYHDTLRKLMPGVNEIIVHLGMDDDELRGITNSYMSRYNDYRVFTDPETQQLIDELQIKLIGWKDIKDSVDF